jgi:hypothetical protein
MIVPMTKRPYLLLRLNLLMVNHLTHAFPHEGCYYFSLRTCKYLIIITTTSKYFKSSISCIYTMRQPSVTTSKFGTFHFCFVYLCGVNFFCTKSCILHMNIFPCYKLDQVRLKFTCI